MIVIVGFAGPVLAEVAHDAWLTESGAHFLFILAGGIWLLADSLKDMRPAFLSIRVTAVLLVFPLILYVCARITGMTWPAWVATWAVAVTLVFDRYGWAGLRRASIPLMLLFCLAPGPIELVVPISDGASAATASLAAELLRTLGVSTAVAPPMLYIEQYEVQVAEACAGLTTLFSLIVCMLLYCQLQHRTNWHRALILALLAVPIALAANALRVLLVAFLLITLGDAWAQGMLHDLAGATLFTIALLCLILVDMTLDVVRK